MKKIFITILAVAALAACTKSEVQYENPGEIGFTPATKNITKAAKESGILSKSDKLGVWALWNYTYSTNTVAGKTGEIYPAADRSSNMYSHYTVEYLSNALFGNRTPTDTWGGVADNGNSVSYPWPTNGALVFAGYTIPATGTVNASYTLNGATADETDDDVMTFTNYAQSDLPAKTYDLCWFGATSSSYDRTHSGSVPVTLSHALTWISFKIMGKNEQSLPVTASWKVTKLTLNSINTVGTGTCKGTTKTIVEGGNTTITPASATWTSLSNQKPMVVFDGEQTITESAVTIEEEDEENGLVIIPQTPTSVTVTWSYPVGSTWKYETKEIPLTLSPENLWKAGVHYTYTIVFDGNEILLTPSYSGWDTKDNEVTIQ